MAAQFVSDRGSGEATEARATYLPLTRDLTLITWSSFVIALLAAAVSVTGIVSGTSVYQTEEMLLLKVPTDLFTVIVAVPLLLVSIWLARRGRLLGLLCWPAPLLYLLYIYVANAIGVPLGILFLPYVTIAALSAYALIGLIACIDTGAVRRRLAEAVPARPAGSAPCFFATAMYIARITGAVAFIVIEVDTLPRGISSKSCSMSRRLLMGTPTLPTSPAAISSSESYPICVGKSNATDSPVWPASKR